MGMCVFIIFSLLLYVFEIFHNKEIQMSETISLKGVVDKGTDLSNFGND